ncbi:MAG TPA: IS4 family transposase [Chloroflexota bacterium]|nr:IS4 family transposase [Chloroflexota bacterium]
MNTTDQASSASPTGPPVPPIVGDIETFLQEMIGRLAPVSLGRGGPGRPRILPSLALWGGLLVCVLRGFTSQLALWRVLTTQQLWFYPRFPVSDQAVYKRLEAGGTKPLEELFVQTSRVLADRLAPYAQTSLAPFATDVIVLDHTDLDQIARRLPALRAVPDGDARLLPGQLAGLFDLRRQQWRTVKFIADQEQNEKVTARELVYSLPRHSLILCDLGFFGFAWFDDLTEHGYSYVSRLRQATSTQVAHTYYAQGDIFDGLVWLGKYRADQAKHAVRLVRFRSKGTLRAYITNVLDPHKLPLADIARLYARRWDFELAANLVKQHLQLHLLWSAKEVVIQQQIWAVLIISQILQALRLEIAGRAQVDPFEVSMDLLVRWLPQLAAGGKDPIQTFVEVGRDARFIRPSSRLTIQAPTIPPDELVPRPGDLILDRTAHHSHRNCGKRPSKKAAKEAQ